MKKNILEQLKTIKNSKKLIDKMEKKKVKLADHFKLLSSTVETNIHMVDKKGELERSTEAYLAMVATLTVLEESGIIKIIK